jgi:catechol 2,3-dioxygenase-like lactoylglutathione lyase family enzyme
MIKGLHHSAYRCRDSEETRAFYEDFLGLRFVSAFEIDEGRGLHSFFEMDDGSCLAFFEVPGRPFDFKRQDTLDLHIALCVEPDVFDSMLGKARNEGVEVRIMAFASRSTCVIRTATWSSCRPTPAFNKKSWIPRCRSRARPSRAKPSRPAAA